MAITAIATLAAVAGCGGDAPRPVVLSHVDRGDTSVAQGVGIIDGRFVPELIAVDAAQPVFFTSRDDTPPPHREGIGAGSRFPLRGPYDGRDLPP